MKNVEHYIKIVYKLSAISDRYAFYASSKALDKKFDSIHSLMQAMPSPYTIPNKYTECDENGISYLQLACISNGSLSPEIALYLLDNYGELTLFSGEAINASEKATNFHTGYSIVQANKQINLIWLEELTNFNKNKNITNFARLIALCIEAWRLANTRIHQLRGSLKDFDSIEAYYNELKDVEVDQNEIKNNLSFFELRALFLKSVLANKEQLNKSTKIRVNLVGDATKLKMLEAERNYYSGILSK